MGKQLTIQMIRECPLMLTLNTDEVGTDDTDPPASASNS